MKKIYAVTLFLVLALSVSASAWGPGMMWGEQDWNYCPTCGQYVGPSGGGYGMGPGMMRGGRHGMMGGYGMGPGMIGDYYGRGPGYYQRSEECQKFFDQSAELRKELNEKRFEYAEAMRNPKTTGESLAKLAKEIYDLQGTIYSKAPRGCW
ncbi:MAG: hypothetical protein ACOYVJ_06660 [Nitrospirota bacterium]